MSAGPRTPFDNSVVEWVDSRLPIFTMLQKEYGVFPTPKNFNYFWNFGAIAMVMLMIMIITGITLAMHYTPHTMFAFDSVERIMRDVNYGWLIRYIHMNGASFFFIAVYTHIFRGMFYGSYKGPRELLWIFGVTIFLLMMATAFMGYVLPWGQMSFWGAKVITSLFGAVPFVGDHIVTWLWGGYGVDNPTLEPLLRSSLSFAIRDCRRRLPSRLGAPCHRVEQPSRHRRQRPAGHTAVPPVLHGEGQLRSGLFPFGLCRFRLLYAERAGSPG